ncbi:hypothetical protein CONCODRAFT_15119 [Conidiobolus coronatus NRRL 28638]|uniref:F-box domain-containing protein n=1 Tax=Conidiobolus coronatus (strain ATCC 28846 / CBS 209.66 / NRRL 28638) TaxID=796925 RepID=A0A137PGH6_CONC2|nr:hypothetical protein CONCODRAFT_15119 [Conidiobolus coronatus NRRL 28638]|eukprot:KXN74088.1 hypothetical protein CONCODRAFT_15119 [Conidiobolus coronatus NRRL 28638]
MNNTIPTIFQFYKYFPSHLKFLDLLEFKNLTGKEQIEAYNTRFTELFEPLSKYVKRLHLYKQFNRYRVLPALALCPNLTNLKLNGMALPLQTLNQIAVNCTNLKIFTLEHIRVIEWTNSLEDPQLALIPPSVTNLNLINCNKMISPLNEDPYNWENHVLVRFTSYEYFNPLDYTLHNLIKVQLILKFKCSTAKLNEFISRHTKLEGLFIWFDYINQETIKILSQMNLKSLRISMTSGPSIDFYIVVPRVLSTVKSLEFTELIPECNQDICKFLTCFRNLRKLTIDCTIHFIEHINIILSNSPELEELTLLNGRKDPTREYYIPKTMENFILPTLPVNNFRVINLRYIHPSYIDIKVFENCVGLKRIMISDYIHYREDLDTNYDTLVQHFNQFEDVGWKVNVYNSDNYISLYKFE